MPFLYRGIRNENLCKVKDFQAVIVWSFSLVKGKKPYGVDYPTLFGYLHESFFFAHDLVNRKTQRHFLVINCLYRQI